MHTRRELLRLFNKVVSVGAASTVFSIAVLHPVKGSTYLLPTLVPNKGEWEGLTSEYDKTTGKLSFYASPNAERALREDPTRIKEWADMVRERAEWFTKRELDRLCISSRS